MTRAGHRIVRAAALIVAVAATALALVKAPQASVDEDARPVRSGIPLAASVPATASLPPLFGAAPDIVATGQAASDAPELIGIAGRLPDDAEALIRRPRGGSVSLRIGGEVDGWRLASLAADRAVFTRDDEQAIAMLPAPDDSGPADPPQ